METPYSKIAVCIKILGEHLVAAPSMKSTMSASAGDGVPTFSMHRFIGQRTLVQIIYLVRVNLRLKLKHQRQMATKSPYAGEKLKDCAIVEDFQLAVRNHVEALTDKAAKDMTCIQVCAGEAIVP